MKILAGECLPARGTSVQEPARVLGGECWRWLVGGDVGAEGMAWAVVEEPTETVVVKQRRIILLHGAYLTTWRVP